MAPRKFLRRAKVGQDNVPVCADEDVFGFEVAVDDAGCMEPFDAFYNFGGIETGSVAS